MTGSGYAVATGSPGADLTFTSGGLVASMTQLTLPVFCPAHKYSHPKSISDTDSQRAPGLNCKDGFKPECELRVLLHPFDLEKNIVLRDSIVLSTCLMG